jgi:hypothetical protein
MAQISDFTIVTYERAPGYWRAAFTPKRIIGVGRGLVHSTVTSHDSATETGAKFAAEQAIRKLDA